MCGRYAASASADLLVETFRIERVGADKPGDVPVLDWMRPRYNIAPTDPVAAVVERPHRDADGHVGVTRRLVGLRWGLVPSWSTSADGAARMINARLETVAQKPAFRKAFAERRCLVPADGYYEWITVQDGSGRPVKQPYFIHPAGAGSLLVMAGVYEFWRRPGTPADAPDAWLASCSIITSPASDDLGTIHDRMPVQIRPPDWDDWLDPGLTDPAGAMSLVHVPAPGEMTAHAVSCAVNSVRNDGPQLIEKIELREESR